jgi:hypothetical protein
VVVVVVVVVVVEVVVVGVKDPDHRRQIRQRRVLRRRAAVLILRVVPRVVQIENEREAQNKKRYLYRKMRIQNCTYTHFHGEGTTCTRTYIIPKANIPKDPSKGNIRYWLLE